MAPPADGRPRDDGGGGAKRKARAAASPSPSPSPASPAAGADYAPPSDSEMEEQLVAHATVAYNEFVSFYNRRASEEIARNRALNMRYLAAQRRVRQRYPVAASAAFLDAMQSLSTAQTSEWPEEPGLMTRTLAKTTVHLASGSAAQQLVKRAVVLPHPKPTPHLTMWTALAKNYAVEDEPQLKFLPYFGDDDNDDVLSEFYQIKLQGTSACEVEFTKELCESVLTTLQTTWDLKPPDLKRVAKAIDVEEEVVMEVYKKLRQSQRAAKKKRRMEAANAAAGGTDGASGQADEDEPALSPENSHFDQYEKAVDSFRSLFCRRCYVYDCDYHGCIEVPKLEVTEQNAVTLQAQERDQMVGTGRNCGNQCFLGQMGSTHSARFSKASAISSAFGWDKTMRAACTRAYFICSGNFCEVAKLLGSKTCLEVAEFCAQNDINHRTLMRGRHNRRPPRKKKSIRVSTSHLQIPQNGSVDAIQTKIEPCSHAGPCSDTNCSCIEDGVFCSKHCNCVHDECKIFFRGCRCVRGRCRTKACPCFAAGRECDLDLCAVCCADEIAALKTNGAGDKTAESGVSVGVHAQPNEVGASLDAKLKEEEEEEDRNGSGCSAESGRRSRKGDDKLTSCQNRSLTLSSQKRLHLARSTMEEAGWGLFAGEPIAKDEFIIEYIGEMVTQEEAERRGAIYDKVNQSYLFNLDTKTVIDSTRKGNKTRFINHSKQPNCYCKIINANSDYRIGLFALRDIAMHTELFFDYRYDKEMHHAELLKMPTVTKWMKSRPKSSFSNRRGK